MPTLTCRDGRVVDGLGVGCLEHVLWEWLADADTLVHCNIQLQRRVFWSLCWLHTDKLYARRILLLGKLAAVTISSSISPAIAKELT